MFVGGCGCVRHTVANTKCHKTEEEEEGKGRMNVTRFHYPARLKCIPNIIIEWLLYFKANGRRFVCHCIYSNITKHPSSLSLSTNFSNKKKAEQILYEYE
jgi:hypothetical protein